MGNRKIPFGYKMELGNIVIQEEKAAIVREIFKEYLLGKSLKGLAEAMTEQAIPYDGERGWNKNIISRMLADCRYTGEKGFPKLIEPQELLAAEEKRSQKTAPTQKTEVQKILRRLCGESSPEWVEREVMGLLSRLIQNPDLIRQPQIQHSNGIRTTQAELDTALEQQPIDEDNAKMLILKLATERYDSLGDEEYETVRLRHLFTKAGQDKEADAELIKSGVSKISFTGQEVKLILKNGQVIQRREAV